MPPVMPTIRSLIVLSALWVSAFLLTACAPAGHPTSCLDYIRTEFGNQTKWTSCPAEQPASPWKPQVP